MSLRSTRKETEKISTQENSIKCVNLLSDQLLLFLSIICRTRTLSPICAMFDQRTVVLTSKFGKVGHSFKTRGTNFCKIKKNNISESPMPEDYQKWVLKDS